MSEAFIPSPSPAPRSPASRVRGAIERWRREPNPVWARELTQTVRRGQTPVLLLLLTTLLALLMASIGGALTSLRSPAQVGSALFQTFFSIAYFLVVLLASAFGASSIGSERDGRTWEPLLLTGLRPEEIAHGKLLACLTTVGVHLVALAPVSALCFLFGGVTVGELALAYVALAAIALLAASFGLAVGARVERLGTALIATIVLVAPLALFGWGTLGWALGSRAHEVWAQVPWAPVWLPAAWARAPFGATYLVWLVLVPAVALAIPVWFFHEATIAGLTSPSDDRSSGLKRWYLVATPVLALAALLPAASLDASARKPAVLAGIAAFFVHLALATFVFAGEPLAASRRVVARWDREGASRLRRMLGPGLARTSLLVLLVGAASLGVATALGALLLLRAPSPEWKGLAELLALATYGAAFFLFLVGVATAARASSPGTGTARTGLGVALFVACVAPWIVALVAGVLLMRNPGDLLLTAPSPFFVPAKVIPAIEDGERGPVVAAAVAAAFWAIAGAALLASGLLRSAAVVRAHEEALAETEARLAAEDAEQAG